MRQRILCLLNSRQALVKTEWAARLRAEPVRSAMADPAILGYLMDETLARLTDQLGRRVTKKARVENGAFESLCRCGLNPLLVYFSTGEAALAKTLAEESSGEDSVQAFLHAQWGLLAQREIDALCGACVRTCSPSCPAGSAALTPTPERAGAGGRGRRSAPLPRYVGKRG